MTRAAVWVGTVIFVLSGAGLAVYLIRVGLDQVHQLASVLGMAASMIGLFIAIAGLVGAAQASGSTGDELLKFALGQIHQFTHGPIAPSLRSPLGPNGCTASVVQQLLSAGEMSVGAQNSVSAVRRNYLVEDLTLDGVDTLLRIITSQPRVTRPPLGELPKLPPHPAPTVREALPAEPVWRVLPAPAPVMWRTEIMTANNHWLPEWSATVNSTSRPSTTRPDSPPADCAQSATGFPP